MNLIEDINEFANYLSSGNKIDRVAEMVGLKRKNNETDEQLQQRINMVSLCK